jgi:Tfp pilus assembly protein PilF
MSNHELAIKDFEKALEIDPKYSEAFFHLGKSRLASKDVMQAEKDFKKALDMSDKPEIYEGLGLCFHMKQEYEEAVNHFTDAISKDPTNVQFCRSLSRCYYDQDKFEQSITCLEKARALLKEPDANVYYELGLSLFAERQYKKCLKTLKEALKNDPHESFQPDIYYHLGLAYCREEKFEKAIFPLTKCIDRIPSDIRYTHERAKAYQMIEMHTEAVADFNTVIKRNPQNAHAYFRRAFSLKALKEFS